ncbi:hypothetical protein ANCDUO_05016 [Ancylostoma duodenale]|uniref:Uncharacterized protein n=1 Tax=Ancylostoma duodenale TaxID=51022 RepID=A0A0C2DPT4_9BILA|nr:hypothetical protein ANCDUO_05016 [Ancylostoma duodenale]
MASDAKPCGDLDTHESESASDRSGDSDFLASDCVVIPPKKPKRIEITAIVRATHPDSNEVKIQLSGNFVRTLTGGERGGEGRRAAIGAVGPRGPRRPCGPSGPGGPGGPGGPALERYEVQLRKRNTQQSDFAISKEKT